MTIIDYIDYQRLQKQELDVKNYLLDLVGNEIGFPAPIPFLIASHSTLYSRQEKMVKYIREHYNESFSVEDL